MVRRLGLLLTVVGAMVLACTGVVLAQADNESRGKEPLSSQAAAKARAIPGHYIVVLDDGKVGQAAQNDGQSPVRVAGAMAQKFDLEVTHTYSAALEGFAAEIPAGRLSAVRSDPRVEYVVQDREVQASAQTLPTGVDRVDSDLSSTAAGNGSGAVNADIAVIDTGIYKQHRDLNISGGYNCTSTKRKAWSDGNGHGTHVAGSAAAKDDAAGVVGTAPGARLWAMKVLDSKGSGTWSRVICGVNRVTKMNQDTDSANDIEVANMSLGGWVGSGADDGNCGNTNNDPLHKAICKSVAAGVTYVVAAGNDDWNASEYVPASYDEVITVSALADYNGRPNGGTSNTCGQDYATDDFAWFSNWGSDVDLGAPGVCIKSTWKGGGYKTISGTSMASPHVAGVAALYKSNNPSKTPAQIRTDMTSAANTEAEGSGHTDDYNLHPEPVMLANNY